MSPPARVAWIETPTPPRSCVTAPVATREGGVDRNSRHITPTYKKAVATREGGVDRNTLYRSTGKSKPQSPPARVAWIETQVRQPVPDICIVATREGGVDRNVVICPKNHRKKASPPARVAWLETTSDI